MRLYIAPQGQMFPDGVETHICVSALGPKARIGFPVRSGDLVTLRRGF